MLKDVATLFLKRSTRKHVS